MSLVVSLPDEALTRAVGPLTDTRVLVWSLEGPPPEPVIDLVVLPYLDVGERLARLEGVRTRLVQAQTLGYDNLVGAMPAGHRLANAVGVHEGPTAELAVALILASTRGVDDAARDLGARRWAPRWRTGLLGSRVLLVGYGGVGRALADRLEPFDVELVVVAAHGRVQDGRVVHPLGDLDELLADADVVVVTVPLTASTEGLVDGPFLARMRDGALLVNVARGRVVDTNALTEALASGRIRAALDVVDPEPLPADHALWSSPGLLLTPHVGGLVTSMGARVASLVRTQVERLRAGDEPLHLVREA